MDNNSEKFSIVKRAKSFSNAFRGLFIFFKTTHNSWVEIFLFIVVLFMGFKFNITKVDWILVFISSGIVFVAEAFNTAIEIDIDLTSPEYHPYARDTKDVAAGAVLIASIMALIVELIIFLPYTL